MSNHAHITPEHATSIASMANVDTTTVKRWLAEEPVREASAERIGRAYNAFRACEPTSVSTEELMARVAELHAKLSRP